MSTKFMNGPLEHERQTRDALDSDSSKLDDVVTTSKAVSWPKVRNWISGVFKAFKIGIFP